MDQINPLVVSAPFGNRIQFPGVTSTLGTFTYHYRAGWLVRHLRLITRLRWSPTMRAWRNWLGLPNPGIGWLNARHLHRRIRVSDKIVSIHGFTTQEWYKLLDITYDMRPLGIELNVSCPNVQHPAEWLGIVDMACKWAVEFGVDCRNQCRSAPWVIVKLPPLGYQQLATIAFERGVRWFHACNTLPVEPRGGISGKPLKPLSLECVKWLRWEFGKDAKIVGGGGVRTVKDAYDYKLAGADCVAVGTALFNPLLRRRRLRKLREYLYSVPR